MKTGERVEVTSHHSGDQDIADVVVFLASDRARYVTGQEVVVDGGFAQTLMSHVPRRGFG